MHIVKFTGHHGSRPAVGVLDAGVVTEIAGISGLHELLSLGVAGAKSLCQHADGPTHAESEVRLLAPVDGRTEVWAAGVTYQNSRLARMEESEHDADIYERVYHARRPELFFKAPSWKVSGSGEPISVRADSEINVPEPEAALVLTSSGEIFGYTVCNDVSSRSLEAENPLYLPQAKIYAGACALGPAIRPAWEIADPMALAIGVEIVRNGEVVWSGQASTGQLNRTFEDLAACLFEADTFEHGAILSTGTCVVPALPFTLAPLDVVSIELASVGRLVNTVTVGSAQFRASLAEARVS